MATALAENCIYTIIHPDRIAAAMRKGRSATFHESKRWVTGLHLWQQAASHAVGMPVLLGDSTDCSRLLHWGLLTKVKVGDGGTTFTVDRIRQLPRRHTPQELVLRSTGQHLAPHFIRPYALCRTPDFVKE